MLHVSRPVRWDSDHVVIMDDELMAIMQEIVRNGIEDRVHIGLDYFDASINRIAAWTVGARNARKALLRAYLEPAAMLKQCEANGDNTSVLALSEELDVYKRQPQPRRHGHARRRARRGRRYDAAAPENPRREKADLYAYLHAADGDCRF